MLKSNLKMTRANIWLALLACITTVGVTRGQLREGDKMTGSLDGADTSRLSSNLVSADKSLNVGAVDNAAKSGFLLDAVRRQEGVICDTATDLQVQGNLCLCIVRTGVLCDPDNRAFKTLQAADLIDNFNNRKLKQNCSRSLMNLAKMQMREHCLGKKLCDHISGLPTIAEKKAAYESSVHMLPLFPMSCDLPLVEALIADADTADKVKALAPAIKNPMLKPLVTEKLEELSGGTLAPADVTDEVAQGMSPDDFSRVLRDASTSEERTQVGRTMMREAARQRKERKERRMLNQNRHEQKRSEKKDSMRPGTLARRAARTIDKATATVEEVKEIFTSGGEAGLKCSDIETLGADKVCITEGGVLDNVNRPCILRKIREICSSRADFANMSANVRASKKGSEIQAELQTLVGDVTALRAKVAVYSEEKDRLTYDQLKMLKRTVKSVFEDPDNINEDTVIEMNVVFNQLSIDITKTAPYAQTTEGKTLICSKFKEAAFNQENTREIRKKKQFCMQNANVSVCDLGRMMEGLTREDVMAASSEEVTICARDLASRPRDSMARRAVIEKKTGGGTISQLTDPVDIKDLTTAILDTTTPAEIAQNQNLVKQMPDLVKAARNMKAKCEETACTREDRERYSNTDLQAGIVKETLSSYITATTPNSARRKRRNTQEIICDSLSIEDTEVNYAPSMTASQIGTIACAAFALESNRGCLYKLNVDGLDQDQLDALATRALECDQAKTAADLPHALQAELGAILLGFDNLDFANLSSVAAPSVLSGITSGKLDMKPSASRVQSAYTKAKNDNNLNPSALTGTDLDDLGFLLCGMNVQMMAEMPNDAFITAMETLGGLTCFTDEALVSLATKAPAAKGVNNAAELDDATIGTLGTIIAGFDPAFFEGLTDSAKVGAIKESALRRTTPAKIAALGNNVEHLSPTQAGTLTQPQRDALSVDQCTLLNTVTDEVNFCNKTATYEAPTAEPENNSNGGTPTEEPTSGGGGGQQTGSSGNTNSTTGGNNTDSVSTSKNTTSGSSGDGSPNAENGGSSDTSTSEPEGSGSSKNDSTAEGGSSEGSGSTGEGSSTSDGSGSSGGDGSSTSDGSGSSGGDGSGSSGGDGSTTDGSGSSGGDGSSGSTAITLDSIESIDFSKIDVGSIAKTSVDILKDPAVLNKLTDGENINYAALGSTIDKLKDTMANVYDGSETATAAQLKSWARYASQKDIDKLSADKVEEVLKQGDMDGHERFTYAKQVPRVFDNVDATNRDDKLKAVKDHLKMVTPRELSKVLEKSKVTKETMAALADAELTDTQKRMIVKKYTDDNNIKFADMTAAEQKVHVKSLGRSLASAIPIKDLKKEALMETMALTESDSEEPVMGYAFNLKEAVMPNPNMAAIMSKIRTEDPDLFTAVDSIQTIVKQAGRLLSGSDVQAFPKEKFCSTDMDFEEFALFQPVGKNIYEKCGASDKLSTTLIEGLLDKALHIHASSAKIISDVDTADVVKLFGTLLESRPKVEAVVTAASKVFDATSTTNYEKLEAVLGLLSVENLQKVKEADRPAFCKRVACTKVYTHAASELQPALDFCLPHLTCADLVCSKEDFAPTLVSALRAKHIAENGTAVLKCGAIKLECLHALSMKVMDCDARAAIVGCVKDNLKLDDTSNLYALGTFCDQFTDADWKSITADKMCSLYGRITEELKDQLQLKGFVENYLPSDSCAGLSAGKKMCYDKLSATAESATCSTISGRRRRATTTYTCIDIQEMGLLVSAKLTASAIEALDSSVFEDCVDSLASVSDFSSEQWKALAAKAIKVWGAVDTWKIDETISAGGILSGLSTADITTLDMSDVDAVTNAGRYGVWSVANRKAMYLQVVKDHLGDDIATVGSDTLVIMGHLVCGAPNDDIKKIKAKNYCNAAHLIGVQTTCEATQMQAYVGLAQHADCFKSDVTAWPSSSVAAVGSMIGGLTKEDIAKLDQSQIETIPPYAIKVMPPMQVNGFTEAQLKHMNLNQFQMMTASQLDSLDPGKAAFVRQELGPLTVDDGEMETTTQASGTEWLEASLMLVLTGFLAAFLRI